MTLRPLLGLLVAVVVSGCVGPARLDPSGAATGGLAPVDDGGAAFVVGIYLALGAVIAAGFVLGFVIDLFFLPFSGNDPDLFFPCCRSFAKVLKWAF